MPSINVDFNSIDANGLVRGSTDDVDSMLFTGERVLAYDDDGNDCEATVVAVDQDRGIVRLQLDLSTWRDEVPPAPEVVARASDGWAVKVARTGITVLAAGSTGSLVKPSLSGGGPHRQPA